MNIAGWDSGWRMPQLDYPAPCRGTHRWFAPGRGNQVHLIWPTYFAPTPTFEPYLHCLARSRGCAMSATAASRAQVVHP